MASQLTKELTGIEELSSVLLSTLEESKFFSELVNYLNSSVKADNVQVFRVLDDSSAEMIVNNGNPVENREKIAKGEGLVGYIIRTKKPYFSNSTGRDPLCASSSHKAELAIPVVSEGIVLATIHFQSNEEDCYSREDITHVLSVFNELTVPFNNVKMYLSAKSLNEILMRRIEEKEQELNDKSEKAEMEEAYKISEPRMIGRADIMKNLVGLADKVAKENMNAMIVGAPGTGKEMLARRMHCRSPRNEAAFISVECGSMNEQELDELLFGKEINENNLGKRTVKGVLEKANGGTVLLKNIPELKSQNVQAKLLHFLKEGIGHRANNQGSFKSNAKILSTSSVDVAEITTIRSDLLFILSPAKVEVPSLSERVEDIEVLAHYFLNDSKTRIEHKMISSDTLKMLCEYSWPGNVRELMSVMEGARVLSDGTTIETGHLANSIREELAEEAKSPNQELISFAGLTLEEMEKKHICMTLEQLGGNKTKTAKTLGITVKTLYNKLHSYGMIAAKEA